jgi:hypothetical protein
MNFKTLFKSAFFAGICVSSTAQAKITVNAAQRDQLIQSLKVWSQPEVPVASFQMLNSPDGSVKFNDNVNCTFFDSFYSDVSNAGDTTKFWCALNRNEPEKTKIKVRYDSDNGEVFGEIASTRLLTALGFLTEKANPVKVNCSNCPEEPWKYLNYMAYYKKVPSKMSPPSGTSSLQDMANSRMENAVQYLMNAQSQRKALGPDHITTFSLALTEEKYKGDSIELENSDKRAGFLFNELSKIDPAQGGSSRTEIDALKLALVFIQHGDSHLMNQKLVCPHNKIIKNADGTKSCSEPHLMLHDVGSTFGNGATRVLGFIGAITESSKLSFKNWQSRHIWSNPATCEANLFDSSNGSLKNPKISESGRRMLADLMSELSDQQITDLFTATRVEERTGQSTGTVEQWAQVFKEKRAEIVNAHCPE